MSLQLHTDSRRLAVRSALVAFAGCGILALGAWTPTASAAAGTAVNTPGGSLPTQCSQLSNGGFDQTSSTGGIACSAISKLSWTTRTKTLEAGCPVSYPYAANPYVYYSNGIDESYWENTNPTLADWGGTGSTNSLQNVSQSPGSSTSPGYVKTEIYHFALDTNHVQSFTTCSMYPQAH